MFRLHWNKKEESFYLRKRFFPFLLQIVKSKISDISEQLRILERKGYVTEKSMREKWRRQKSNHSHFFNF